MINFRFRKSSLFFIFCLLFADLKSTAQAPITKVAPDQYHAIHWTTEDGLPGDLANVMIKDAKGFLWVGSVTDVLSRFDGATFKKYYSTQHKRDAINGSDITALVEDSLNNIWIGASIGLFRYDMKADTFTRFYGDTGSVNSIRSIIPFWSTSDRVFCLESGSSIVTYNIHSGKKDPVPVVKLTDSDNVPDVFPGINYTIVDTVANCLWMIEGTRSYWWKGLLQISLNDGVRRHYPWLCYRNIPNHDHRVEAMKLDHKRNCIWINSTDGLLKFSLVDKKFYPITALNEFAQMKNYDCDVGIDIDLFGRIWLTTRPVGILIYDPNTEHVRELFSDPDLQQKTGGAVLHLYCDRDGIVWTSYWDHRGVYELLPFNPSVKRYTANPKMQDSLSNRSILAIVPGAQGQLWIGTEDGLNIFDPNTEKFEVLRANDLPVIGGNSILPLAIDTIRQKAWLKVEYFHPVHKSRTYEMDIRTRKCRPIIFRDGLKQLNDVEIHGWHSYKNGLLLSNQNYGFFEINSESLFADLVIPFKKELGGSALEDDHLLFLKNWDRNGSLPPNFTFQNINGKWRRSPHLLDKLEWLSIVYSKKDQTYWVSFRSELVHYTKDFRKIRSYDEKDGYNGIIHNMLTDNEGNLWFNSVSQVSRLEVSTGIITTLSEADGYQKQGHGSKAKDISGNIYFGGNGLDRIRPERYSSPVTSSVYLRSVSINQKPFDFSLGVNNLEELSLRHNQNTISIETGIIDYYSLGKSRIRYKMEGTGKNEDWQYGPAYYTIRYDGLSPGNYKLILQSSNVAGEFNSTQKVLSIIIKPPFWETWWFRIAAGISIITIIYTIVQFRSRSLRRQNVQLEEKVVTRTQELKHSLEELKETQTQLIQREKMASLGELTAGIAHEIQNPLNFVKNFSEVSTELVGEMKEEFRTGHGNEAIIIADDIEENLKKIVHYGNRADAIVKGMLQHSRASTGIKEPTDINALVDEYLRLSYHGFRSKDNSFNVILHTDLDRNLGKINLIPQEIGRVLQNLFNNAFYAVAEKKGKAETGYEPQVSVSTRLIHISGTGLRTVEIRVRDNGNGIPEKVYDKIFQPFFTTKPTGEGTGLGLSLSYDIITKLHNGELRTETRQGEYAEFIINFPI